MNSDKKAEHRRLAILQLLQKEPRGRLDEQILCELLEDVERGAPLSVVRGDIAWLEQQGLVATEDLFQTKIALLRQSGLDVARGLSAYPGVSRLPLK